MASPAVVNLVMQRDIGDCAIACVAMLLGKSYEDVSAKALKLFASKKPHRAGLHTSEIKRLAKAFGVTLISVKPEAIDTEGDTGILLTRRHAVLMFEGVVWNPAEGLLYNFETFTAQRGWKPEVLLRS